MTATGSFGCQTLSRSAVILAASFLFAISAGDRAAAVEIILQNDSLPTPGTGVVLNAFIPGERAASWFTAPATGDIVGVQVFWASLFGGAPDQLETAITVSTNGTFPTVGVADATIPGPMLVDGSDNEFRTIDSPIDAIPLHVPVAAGQSFSVDIEFLNQSAGNAFAPSIETDADGTMAGAQSVFVMPGGWVDANPLGIQGDFAIRAIFAYAPTPGDGNDDGKVDGLDYLLWAGNFGDDPAADPPGSPGNGDYNNDGKVDGLDYLLWAGNFGQGPLDATAVPEPGTLALLLVGMAMLATRCRRMRDLA
jgi:hypothetical protein